jgi:hypothetical protein
MCLKAQMSRLRSPDVGPLLTSQTIKRAKKSGLSRTSVERNADGIGITNQDAISFCASAEVSASPAMTSAPTRSAIRL